MKNIRKKQIKDLFHLFKKTFMFYTIFFSGINQKGLAISFNKDFSIIIKGFKKNHFWIKEYEHKNKFNIIKCTINENNPNELIGDYYEYNNKGQVNKYYKFKNNKIYIYKYKITTNFFHPNQGWITIKYYKKINNIKN